MKCETRVGILITSVSVCIDCNICWILCCVTSLYWAHWSGGSLKLYCATILSNNNPFRASYMHQRNIKKPNRMRDREEKTYNETSFFHKKFDIHEHQYTYKQTRFDLFARVFRLDGICVVHTIQWDLYRIPTVSAHIVLVMILIWIGWNGMLSD